MASVAQNTPDLILREIFCYLLGDDLVDESEQPIPGIEYHNRNRGLEPRAANARLLTQICHLWRHTAMGIIFEHPDFNGIHPSSGRNPKFIRWIESHRLRPSLYDAVRFGVVNSVRSVSLSCNLAGLLLGTSLDGFYKDPLHGRVFPSVTTIKISFTAGADVKSIDITGSRSSATQFSRTLARAFPEAGSICFELPVANWDAPCGRFFDIFYAKLLEGKQKVRVSTLAPALNIRADLGGILSQGTAPLCGLEIDNVKDGSPACAVIRNNSLTLRTLKISSESATALHDILFHVDRSPVVYHSLCSLAFKDYVGPLVNATGSLPEDRFFPLLEDLACESKFTYTHRVLLYNSSATLHSMRLNLSCESLGNLLLDHRFSSQSYPMLQHMAICGEGPLDMHPHVNKLLLQFGRTAQVSLRLGLLEGIFDDYTREIMMLSQHLQKLDLRHTLAKFRDILALIKTLPDLRELSIGIIGFTATRGRDEDYWLHEQCPGTCRIGREDVIQRSDQTRENMTMAKFIHNHMDVICSDKQYLYDLFKSLHPVSTRLVVYDACAYCEEKMNTASLMELSVDIVQFALLCPSIQEIYWSCERKYILRRSHLRKYAAFRDIENRLLASVNDTS